MVLRISAASSWLNFVFAGLRKRLCIADEAALFPSYSASAVVRLMRSLGLAAQSEVNSDLVPRIEEPE